jgi:type IV secretion system protein VirB5
MNFDRIYSPEQSHEPRTEHWMLSVTYYLNPAQVSNQARTNPQYETINPLGLTITEFHENRVSVDPISDGSRYRPQSNPPTNPEVKP